MTVRALRSTAQRIQLLAAEAAELEVEITKLVRAAATWPLEHTVALARLRHDPRTRAYAARRRAEVRSGREIRRCVKRAVARQLFELLERYDPAQMQPVTIL
jgi:hypothetical protein